MAARVAALLPLVAVLAACSPSGGSGVKVAVDRRGRDIVFTASRGDGPACFDQLFVSDAAETTRHLWAVTIDPAGPCVSRVAYGRLPARAAAEIPAQPLRPGGRYLVEVLGTHLLGGERFVVADRQGSLVEPGG